jgi:hypothetical protein
MTTAALSAALSLAMAPGAGAQPAPQSAASAPPIVCPQIVDSEWLDDRTLAIEHSGAAATLRIYGTSTMTALDIPFSPVVVVHVAEPQPAIRALTLTPAALENACGTQLWMPTVKAKSPFGISDLKAMALAATPIDPPAPRPYHPACASPFEMPALIHAATPGSLEHGSLRQALTLAVLVKLGADGKPQGAEVVQSPEPQLDALAITAARASTFAPEMIDCRNVAATIVDPVTIMPT